VYEDEIPKKLVVGEKYSAEQMKFYITDNDVVVLSKDPVSFFTPSIKKFVVTKIDEAFVHEKAGIGGYRSSDKKKRIYTIESTY
jgi:hypothetical protein